MSDHVYDMVVIGGGPAGSMAALTAVERGLSVLLVERDPVIGSPVRCAEGVDDAGLRQFFEPDPSWIASEITGYMLVAPDGTKVPMHTEGYNGWILERTIFDRMIAEKAADAGADIRTGTEATGVSPYESGYRSVMLRDAENEWTVRANVVIAADGVESLAARWAGLKTRTLPIDIESCAQATCADLDIESHIFRMHFTGTFAPGGYAWVFPKKPGTANIGLGITGSCTRNRSPKKLLDAYLATYFPDARILNYTYGGIPCSGGVEKTIADGLMVAGDAAHHANPVTGGGIINALVAGKLAGETAADALETGSTNAESLAPYTKKLQKRFDTMNRKTYKIKDAVFSIPDDRLNALAATALNIPLEKRTPLRLLREAFIKKPDLLLSLAKVMF